jgi:hypothetical protein
MSNTEHQESIMLSVIMLTSAFFIGMQSVIWLSVIMPVSAVECEKINEKQQDPGFDPQPGQTVINVTIQYE